jgi:hypothetical protein
MKFSGQVLIIGRVTPRVGAAIELLKVDQILDENRYYRILEAVEGNYQIRCRILNPNIYYNSAVDTHLPRTKAQEIMATGSVLR